MTLEVFSFIEMGFFLISSAPRADLPTASVALPLLQLCYDRKGVYLCKVSFPANEACSNEHLHVFLVRIVWS